MPGEILFSQEAGIATLTLSNPDKLNAVDADMWRALQRSMSAINGDPGVRCVVLRGAGDKAFAAGGDIEEFLTVRATVDDALHYHEGLVAAALDAIRACPVPTVAMIQGACIGGGLEIAGCCDIRIAGESSRFGAPINKLGFSMYPGEMAGLLELVGPAVLLEILLEGRVMNGREALAKGLVARVVADDQVEREAMAAARRIADGAPLVNRIHKRMIRRVEQEAPIDAIDVAESYSVYGSEDFRIGVAAFLAKKKPEFGGR